MQILGAPSTLELRNTEPLRLSFLVHNESDDDVVCFPTLDGAAAVADVEFEPALGFVEGRSTARFDVRVGHLGGTTIQPGGLAARWQLFARGALQDERPCALEIEPPRSVHAEFVGMRALRLENRGSRAESLSVRLAPGFGGDLLVPSGPFDVAPGEQYEVPLYISGGEESNEHLGLLIVGGPEPLLLQLDVRPEFALAASAAALRRPARPPRRVAVAALGAALAASLALALTLGGRIPGLTSSSATPSLAPAPPVAAQPVAALGGDRYQARLAAVPHAVDHHAPARARRAAAIPAAVARAPVTPRPLPPAIVALSIPDSASSGDHVRVRFATKRATQVEVLAKVGPVVIADHITSATSGYITVPAPKTSRWVKIMTVRVLAQRDGGHASRSGLVAILPPNDVAANREISLR
ncbi:hypothetical protein EPN52_14375 [bacterium]|nr:MAG: hypothetical protein EPN52_14375 [bacterium]